MKSKRFYYLLATALVAAMGSAGFMVKNANAQQTENKQSGLFQRVTDLPNGIELKKGPIVLLVLALRDDTIRIRIAQDGQIPEDASWAALQSSRNTSVNVTPINGNDYLGFTTSALQVKIATQTGAISVFDKDGQPILEDAKQTPFVKEENGFRLVKKLPEDLHIVGLGDKPGPLDRRGYVFQNWNTDFYLFQEREDPTYHTIPFFMGFKDGKTYGVFMDNTWRSVFDFGVNQKDVMSFGADNGPIDYYVFAGPSSKNVIEAYSWLVGRPPLPPKWSFGYQQSRYSYANEKLVRNIIAQMRANKIPCDVIWFDIDALYKHRAFQIDKTAFPDFKKLIADLHDQGIKSVLVSDPHIAYIPEGGYDPYDIGSIQKDTFVQNKDHKDFVGNVWPGPSVFPDVTNQIARAYWGDLFQNLYLNDNVDGFWNDMNEPSVFNVSSKTMPLDNIHKINQDGFQSRTATHEEIHNVYGQLVARATYDGLLRIKQNQRPFVMHRASYAGGQRYGATWTGDNTSSWNHLRLGTPMLLGLGLSGFPYAGDNLGGFIYSPSADLLTRWLQIGMFNPIADNHTDKETRMQEPWVDGKKHLDIRRHFIEDRYRLMPYIYTIAEEASRTGIPMMRPLFMEFPDAAGGMLDLQASQEFMWGSSILVAPAPFGEQVNPYKIILPPGEWYDYWTGEKIDIEHTKIAEFVANSGITTTLKGKTTTLSHEIMEQPVLDHLPVFVRAGSIIPRQPLVQNTSQMPKGPLSLYVYNGSGQGSIYLDDGISFAYKQGNYFRQNFNIERVSDTQLKLILQKPEGPFKPWWKQIQVTLYGVYSKNNQIHIEGAKAQDIKYDPIRHSLTFSIPYSTNQINLIIQL